MDISTPQSLIDAAKKAVGNLVRDPGILARLRTSQDRVRRVLGNRGGVGILGLHGDDLHGRSVILVLVDSLTAGNLPRIQSHDSKSTERLL